jgi:hypothetical protein
VVSTSSFQLALKSPGLQMTVPPYSAAFVFMVTLSVISDRIGKRGPFVAVSSLIAGTGYVILLASANNHARYGATFLVTAGTYSALPLMMAWNTTNNGSETCPNPLFLE